MLTCRANKLWSTIHNAKPDDPRMVCFLPDKQAIAAWLDPGRSYESLKELLSPMADEPGLLVSTHHVGLL